MKSYSTFILIVLLHVLGQSTVAQSLDPQISVGLRAGYHDGVAFEGYGIISDFAEGFPFAMRVGISRTAVQPGSALDARRIFINNATNGDPEKKGKTWHHKLDFLAPVSLLSQARTYLYGGIRYSKFTANFRFVGGNEDFDVKSSQWGLGAGLESYFAMGQRVDFVVGGGLDGFFSSTLSGHDTSYSPDGESVNPREDYTYSDADEAIAQPKWEPVFTLGINYRF